MTSNYKELERIAIKKFGSLGAFSIWKYDNAGAVNGLKFMADNIYNVIKIDVIIDEIKNANVKKNEYIISDYDRKVIKGRMKVVLEGLNKNHNLPIKWNRTNFLRHKGIRPQLYYQIMCGNYKLKNDQYFELLKALGLWNG